MRSIFRASVLCLVVVAGGACNPDEVISTENIPTGGVRFINAVPDTGASYGMDFRFIDLAENNAQFRVPFRNNPSTSGGVTASTHGHSRNGLPVSIGYRSSELESWGNRRWGSPKSKTVSHRNGVATRKYG